MPVIMETNWLSRIKFSKELGHDLYEGTVRNFKSKYLDKGKSLNGQFKALLNQEFSRWYASEVQQALWQGVAISESKVDLTDGIFNN